MRPAWCGFVVLHDVLRRTPATDRGSVAGLVFGEDAARGQVIRAQLEGFLGEEGAAAIEGLLQERGATRQRASSERVGVVLPLVGATTVFAELQSSLDRIWRVPERESRSGLMGAAARTTAVVRTDPRSSVFVMIVSLIASAAMSALGEWWAPYSAAGQIVLQAVNFVLSFGLVTAVFAMIYKLMPRVRITGATCGSARSSPRCCSPSASS